MNLPFQLSDAVTLVAVAALWRPRPLLVELVYYWAFAATLQALATPDLRQAYPDVLYFTYFATHGGALAAACLLVIGERRLPRAGSALRAFAVTAALRASRRRSRPWPPAATTCSCAASRPAARCSTRWARGRSTSPPRRRSAWRCSWFSRPPPDTMLAPMRRGLLALAATLLAATLAADPAAARRAPCAEGAKQPLCTFQDARA